MVDAVEVVVLHEVAHERAHVRAYLLVREVDGAPVAERRTLPLLGTPHQAVGIVLLEVGEERIRLLERTGGVVRVVHADRHEDLQPVRAAELRRKFKRVCPHREEVGRRMFQTPVRAHAVGFARLAAGEAPEPGAERTVRDGGDPRAERVDEPPPREVLDRHRQVRGPVVRIVAVRVVHELARSSSQDASSCARTFMAKTVHALTATMNARTPMWMR